MQRPTQLTGRRRRLLAVIGVSALVALAAAPASVSTVSLLPPKLEPRQLEIGAAATHLLVDSPLRGTIAPELLPQHADGLVKRADLLGRIMVTPPALEHIGRRAGVAPERIGAFARVTASVPRALREPGSEERASEIARSRRPYRLEVQPRRSVPILDIYTQAPSAGEAKRLANAAVSGLRDYLNAVASRRPFDAQFAHVRLRQQGPARGSVVNVGARSSIAVLTFVVVFALSLCGLLVLMQIWRRSASPTQHRRRRLPTDQGDRDDWPRTTRLLPWLLAGFIAILWLIPFNSIELEASLPIDLKFDRLVLPFIAATWVLALAAGGAAAPRVRFTWIHSAVAAFVLCAFLSVVVNARELNDALELDQSLKRLPLLAAYVSLFFMAASIVRRSEVRAFLTYSLGLAVVCAIGIIWEYRFEYNVFYDLPDKLLPGFFQVGEAEAAAVDGIGRRIVRGPSAVPLEAVAMLSMALPIAVVGAMRTGPWRGRLLHGLAGCVIFAAVVATFRKSGLLAPASALLTLAFFRRRELLKLAPLGLVGLGAVHLLAPAALGSTVSQLDPGRLGVATVSERTIDYDAIRPEVWTNLAFGRGWGTYDFENYRILDSELLQRLVETGVIGLLAYLLMGISVVAAARASIASRDPVRAPPALIGAAAAVSFVVVSALFDVMSFPHVPYLFLFLAGLVAVVVGASREPEPAWPPGAGLARDSGRQPRSPAGRVPTGKAAGVG